jgi:hypothetical protein
MACVLCGRELKARLVEAQLEPKFLADCETCGKFWIDGLGVRARSFEDEALQPYKYRLSAMTKASRVPILIDRKVRDNLREGFPLDKTVPDKIELVMRWLEEKTDEIGRAVPTDSQHDYPIGWCKGPTEWTALLQYLAQPDVGYIKTFGTAPALHAVAVTFKGLEWLDDRPKATGSKAFIAMAFDPKLDEVKAAITAAITKAGYDPLRVDDDHYSGGVMDRIITQIRDSKFIVADFTKNRGGVYYEAGAAFGLGIPVVHVCEAGCLTDGSTDRLHFDVRHLRFIAWDAAQLAKFTEDLCNHIVALHGRGPRPTS